MSSILDDFEEDEEEENLKEREFLVGNWHFIENLGLI